MMQHICIGVEEKLKYLDILDIKAIIKMDRCSLMLIG